MATLSNFLERVSMIMLLSAISSPLSSMKGNIPFLERCLHLWSTFCNKMQTLELEHYSLFYIWLWQSSPLSGLESLSGWDTLCNGKACGCSQVKLPKKRNKAWIKFKLSCHWKCPTFLPSGPRPHLNYFSLPTSQSMFDKNIKLDTNWIKSVISDCKLMIIPSKSSRHGKFNQGPVTMYITV